MSAGPSNGGRRLVRELATEEFVPIRDAVSAFGGDPRGDARMCELISRERSGSEDLSVGVIRLEPGQRHAEHHHPNASEFYYFYEGECALRVDGQDVRARPGTVVYIPEDCVHAVENDSGEDAAFVYGFSKPSYTESGHRDDG